MAKQKSKLGRPSDPAIKPPVHFGPKSDGVSPEDAKRIIEGRKVSSNIVRPSANSEVSNNV